MKLYRNDLSTESAIFFTEAVILLAPYELWALINNNVLESDNKILFWNVIIWREEFFRDFCGGRKKCKIPWTIYRKTYG